MPAAGAGTAVIARDAPADPDDEMLRDLAPRLVVVLPVGARPLARDPGFQGRGQFFERKED